MENKLEKTLDNIFEKMNQNAQNWTFTYDSEMRDFWGGDLVDYFYKKFSIHKLNGFDKMEAIEALWKMCMIEKGSLTYEVSDIGSVSFRKSK